MATITSLSHTIHNAVRDIQTANYSIRILAVGRTGDGVVRPTGSCAHGSVRTTASDDYIVKHGIFMFERMRVSQEVRACICQAPHKNRIKPVWGKEIREHATGVDGHHVMVIRFARMSVKHTQTHAYILAMQGGSGGIDRTSRATSEVRGALN